MKKSMMNKHTKNWNKAKATMMRTMNLVRTQTIGAEEAGVVAKRAWLKWILRMHLPSSLLKNRKNRLKMRRSTVNTRSRSKNTNKTKTN
jgi:hypothetical protein